MHHVYVRLCKQFNVKSNSLENNSLSIKRGDMTALKSILKNLSSL